MTGLNVRLDTREMDRIVRDLRTNENKVMRRLGFEVERNAKPAAAVDTGALRSSIYTVTEDANGFESAAGAALEKNPDAGLVEIPAIEKSGPVYVRIGPCVEYGVFIEFGTYKMAARPYLLPALEQVADKFNSGGTWRELFDRG